MEDKTASDATNYLLSKVNHKSYGKQAAQTYQYMQRMNNNIKSDKLMEKRRMSQQMKKTGQQDSQEFCDSERIVKKKGKALFVYKNDINKQFKMKILQQFRDKDNSRSRSGSRSKSKSKSHMDKNQVAKDFTAKYLKKCNSPIDKYLSQSLSGVIVSRDQQQKKSIARLENGQTLADTLPRNRMSASGLQTSPKGGQSHALTKEQKDIFQATQWQQRAASAAGSRPRRNTINQRNTVQSAINGRKRYTNSSSHINDQFLDFTYASHQNNMMEPQFSTKQSKTILSNGLKSTMMRSGSRFMSKKSKSIASLKQSQNGKQNHMAFLNEPLNTQINQSIYFKKNEGTEYVKHLISQTQLKHNQKDINKNLEDSQANLSFNQLNDLYKKSLTQNSRRYSSYSQFKQLPNNSSQLADSFVATPIINYKYGQIQSSVSDVTHHQDLISQHILQLKDIKNRRRPLVAEISGSNCSACSKQSQIFQFKTQLLSQDLRPTQGRARNQNNKTQQNPPKKHSLKFQDDNEVNSNEQEEQKLLNIISDINTQSDNKNSQINKSQINKEYQISIEKQDIIDATESKDIINFESEQNQTLPNDTNNNQMNADLAQNQDFTAEIDQTEAFALLKYLKDQRKRDISEKPKKTNQQKIQDKQKQIHKKQQQQKSLEKSLDLLHAYGEFDRFIKESKKFIKSKQIKTDFVRMRSPQYLIKCKKRVEKKQPVPIFSRAKQLNCNVKIKNQYEGISSKVMTYGDFVDVDEIKSTRHLIGEDIYIEHTQDDGEEDQIIYRHQESDEAISGFLLGMTEEQKIIEADDMFSEAILSMEKESQPAISESNYILPDIKNEFIRETDREQQFTNVGHSSHMESNMIKDSTPEDELNAAEKEKMIFEKKQETNQFNLDQELNNNPQEIQVKKDIFIVDLNQLNAQKIDQKNIIEQGHIDVGYNQQSDESQISQQIIEPLNIHAIQKQIDMQLSNKSMNSPKEIISSLRSMKSPLTNKQMVDYLDQDIQIVVTKSTNSNIQAGSTSKLQQLADQISQTQSIKSYASPQSSKKSHLMPSQDGTSNNYQKTEVKQISVNTSITDKKLTKQEDCPNVKHDKQEQIEKHGSTIQSIKYIQNKIDQNSCDENLSFAIENTPNHNGETTPTISGIRKVNKQQVQSLITASQESISQKQQKQVPEHSASQEGKRPDSPTPRNQDEKGIDCAHDNITTENSQNSQKTTTKEQQDILNYGTDEMIKNDLAAMDEFSDQKQVSCEDQQDKMRSETEFIESNTEAYNLKNEQSIVNLQIQVKDLDDNDRKLKLKSMKTQDYNNSTSLIKQQLNHSSQPNINIQSNNLSNQNVAKDVQNRTAILQNSFLDAGEDDEDFYYEECEPEFDYHEGYSIDTQERIKKLNELKKKNLEQYIDMRNTNMVNAPIQEITARKEYSQRSKSKNDSFSLDQLSKISKSYQGPNLKAVSLQISIENQQVQQIENKNQSQLNVTQPSNAEYDQIQIIDIVSKSAPIQTLADNDKVENSSPKLNQIAQLQSDPKRRLKSESSPRKQHSSTPSQSLRGDSSMMMTPASAFPNAMMASFDKIKFQINEKEMIKSEGTEEEYDEEGEGEDEYYDEEEDEEDQELNYQTRNPSLLQVSGTGTQSSVGLNGPLTEGAYSAITVGQVQRNLNIAQKPILDASNEFDIIVNHSSHASAQDQSAEYVIFQKPSQNSEQQYEVLSSSDNYLMNRPKTNASDISNGSKSNHLQANFNVNQDGKYVLLQTTSPQARDQINQLNDSQIQHFTVLNTNMEGPETASNEDSGKTSRERQMEMNKNQDQPSDQGEYYGEEESYGSQSYYEEGEEQEQARVLNQKQTFEQSNSQQIKKNMINQSRVKNKENKMIIQRKELQESLNQGEQSLYSYYDEEEPKNNLNNHN